MKRLSLIVFSLALAVPTGAQVLLNSEGAAKVTRIAETLPKDNTLRCKIEPEQPHLDFTLRLTAGYFVDCPLDAFEGKESNIAAYIRVTPAGGIPMVLVELYQVPAIPPEQSAQLRHARVTVSGGFAVGEGKYLVEVLLVDKRNRIFRKHWTITAAKKQAQKNVSLAVKPGTVSNIYVDPWDGKLVRNGAGLRVAILLDAVPMNPNVAKLRAWDRAFLLGALLSLLQQVPCESVRLTAFSLDQQKEVFRKDPFDGPAFVELSRALKGVEFATVSYRALQRESRPNMLAMLARQELAARDGADVVIFLGPTRWSGDWKTPVELLEAERTGHPRFFYFEYFPRVGYDFPDAIDHLTKTLHGTVFQVHSPAEFGKSIQEMVRQLQSANGNEAPQLGSGRHSAGQVGRISQTK